MKGKCIFLCWTLSIIVSLSFLQSCNSDDMDVQQEEQLSLRSDEVSSTLKTEECPSISTADLLKMKMHLSDAGVDISGFSNVVPPERAIIIDDLLLKVIKVSCKAPHPSNPGELIDASGVIIVPRKTLLTALVNYRMIVMPAPTHTSNDFTPSVAFKNGLSLISGNELNYQYFSALTAAEGFAVFLPDYPGFGDSRNQCFIPYLEKKPMVDVMIKLIKAAKVTLGNEGYRQKEEVILTGMSLGGYVTTCIAREIETNASIGLKTNLLFVGGTSGDSKGVIDKARASVLLEPALSFVWPLATLAYHKNGYKDIIVNQVVKEPYASDTEEYFNGDHSIIEVGLHFPFNVSNLLTENFINNLDTDPALASVREAFVDSNIIPWVNKCPFTMVHGLQDITVYYEPAKGWADQVNAIGGNVNFIPVIGEHAASTISFYSLGPITYSLHK